MTKSARALILSHSLVFAAGAYAGWAVNADELSTYRDAHESKVTRLKRKAGYIGLGVLLMGTVALVARVAAGGSGKKEVAV